MIYEVAGVCTLVISPPCILYVKKKQGVRFIPPFVQGLVGTPIGTKGLLKKVIRPAAGAVFSLAETPDALRGSSV